MLKVIKGDKIPEPMRHVGNLCLSVSLGLLAAFGIAVVTSTTFRRPSLSSMTDEVLLNNDVKFEGTEYKFFKRDQKYSPISTGDRSGGSSCGGSSCSSCSSCGSSCGSSSF